MNTTIAINEAFFGEAYPGTAGLPGFVRTAPHRHGHTDSCALRRRQDHCDSVATKARDTAQQVSRTASGQLKTWGETMVFVLALLLVIGLAGLGTWAAMRLAGSVGQVQAMMQLQSVPHSIGLGLSDWTNGRGR